MRMRRSGWLRSVVSFVRSGRDARAVDTPTRQEVEDKIRYWRELWLEVKRGEHATLTADEVMTQLDVWLDELMILCAVAVATSG